MLPLERAMREVAEPDTLVRHLRSGRIHGTAGNSRVVYGSNQKTGYEFAYAVPSNVELPPFGPDEFLWPRITHHPRKGIDLSSPSGSKDYRASVRVIKEIGAALKRAKKEGTFPL
jgi:hypothetical protein